jgi:hypothetical protein
MNLMLVKVNLLRQQETGAPKVVTEQYLVNAITFGDAEKNTYKFLDGFQAVAVKGITPTPCEEIVKASDDAEIFFKVTTEYLDGEGEGKPKMKKEVRFIIAENLAQAHDAVIQLTAEYMVDVRSTEIKETKILGYYNGAELN